MRKARINCYTIDKDYKITPGIPISMFKHIHTELDRICLPQTPICRFAVEDKFCKLDSSSNKHWIVSTDENAYYYRFTTKDDNNQVYLLILNDNLRKSPCFLSSDNIENDDYLLTKISRNCRFKIEDINISVTDSDISIY